MTELSERVKTRKELNVEATRKAILSVARKHFTKRGFSKAEIGQIASDARLTTGAVYYHFSSKEGLFLAVAEDLEKDILTVVATVQHKDPWKRLKLGIETLIDICSSPAVQRITFVEAPQVIGPLAWRDIELRYAYGAVQRLLGELRAAKIIKPYPIDLVARTMLALLHEASAEVARSKNDSTIRRQVNEMVSNILDAFLERYPS